jgi:prepilin peptidase CpaA
MMSAGGDAVVTALYAAPLMVAAAWDTVSFRIPNTLNLVFLALFPVAVLLAPHGPDWLWHLAAFGLVLAVGILVFSLRLLGGGDVKLMTVAALWLGWDRLIEFVTWVAIFGGVLSVVLLLLRAQMLQPLYAHLGRPPKLLQPKADIPYGVAIAAGGLMLAGRLPLIAG